MSGSRSPMGGVVIAAADAAWPSLFAAERRALEGVAALSRIEHFGSTAVPGLAAKPVIDIMATVAGADALAEAAPALAAQGYQLIDAGFSKRWFFRKLELAPGVSAHLHLVTPEGWETRHERLFRDWLIAHPEAARRYARLKQELAARFPEDREAYTAAKTGFIRDAVNLARRARGLDPQSDWDE